MRRATFSPGAEGAVAGAAKLGAAIEKCARPMKFACQCEERRPTKLVTHFWTLATRIGLILTPNSHAVRSSSTRIWCRTRAKGSGIWWKFDPKAARICISESGLKQISLVVHIFQFCRARAPAANTNPKTRSAAAAAGRNSWARTLSCLLDARVVWSKWWPSCGARLFPRARRVQSRARPNWARPLKNVHDR